MSYFYAKNINRLKETYLRIFYVLYYMRNYKYKLIYTISETDKKEKILDTKDDICKALGISISALNNFLIGRTKHKFDYLTIEKIHTPPPKRERKPLTDEEKEERKIKQREANKRFNERRKKERHETQKKTIIDALDKIPE